MNTLLKAYLYICNFSDMCRETNGHKTVLHPPQIMKDGQIVISDKTD